MIYVGIFISHSWTYTDHYQKLADWFFNNPGGWRSGDTEVRFVDYSVPKDDPIHNADNATELYRVIAGLIASADVVVCPTGMYSTHSKWISKELEAAERLAKPVLAVNPWGQERKSLVVQQKAASSVGWNKQSVVDAAFELRP